MVDLRDTMYIQATEFRHFPVSLWFLAMAGLIQLLFFSEGRNDEARQILADSTNPKRYFPFAAAGVFSFHTYSVPWGTFRGYVFQVSRIV